MRKDDNNNRIRELEREVVGHALQFTYACNEYKYSRENIYEFPRDYMNELVRLFKSTDRLREVFKDCKKKKRAENFVIKTAIDYVYYSDEPDKNSYSGVDLAEYKLFDAVKKIIKSSIKEG